MGVRRNFLRRGEIFVGRQNDVLCMYIMYICMYACITTFNYMASLRYLSKAMYISLSAPIKRILIHMFEKVGSENSRSK